MSEQIKKKNVEETGIRKDRGFNKDSWSPKTALGRKVKSGEIENIDKILDAGQRILEPEIVDALVPNLESELLELGQSKGKFGGGKRTIWKTTQKKTKEGNKPSFTTMAVVGDQDGHVGVGIGKAKETMPAKEKAIKQAKLNIIKIKRGCGSWACGCREPHTIPFEVRGKCGSLDVRISPAPKGTGRCIQKECQKLLRLAGVKDAYSKARGKTASRMNLIKACFAALKQLASMKVREANIEKIGIIAGNKE